MTTLRERLLSKRAVIKGCWIWLGEIGSDGYGHIKDMKTYGRYNKQVHRVAYEQFVAPIPKGMLVLHSCDNRACFNPSHLFLGTQKDNMQDMANKGRATLANAKLTVDEVAAIRADNRLQRLIAADYGVSQSCISLIKRGKQWK